MNRTLAQRLDRLARDMTPVAITFLLALIAIVPLGIPFYASVAPGLVVASVFYWSVYRPDLMPRIAVFALGLLLDLLSGHPLGLNIAVLLFVNWLSVGQRRAIIGKPFFIAWGGFMLIAAGAVVIACVLALVLTAKPILVAPVLFQYLLTFATFPLLAWALIGAHRHFVQ